MRGRSAPLLVSALMLALAAAGCVSPTAGTGKANEAAHMDMDGHHHDGGAMGSTMDFTMGADTCEEGGFVAAYPGAQTYAKVWKSADIWEEIGKPMRSGLGPPY